MNSFVEFFLKIRNSKTITKNSIKYFNFFIKISL